MSVSQIKSRLPTRANNPVEADCHEILVVLQRLLTAAQRKR
jgi:hypothetical protein